MSVDYCNPTIKEIADTIVNALKDKGFTIQRYDAYSTDSVYLKLDYGVCNSIRISDHKGKKHLCYRYNLIVGCEDNIIEERYIRYYFNEKNITGLLCQILFDKQCKIQKYGKVAYKNFMIRNKMEHNKDKDGFWSHAKLVTKDVSENEYKYVDYRTGAYVNPSSRIFI